MSEISELELDGIRESLNISMGKAASTFSSMVHEQIRLSVPNLQFASPSEAFEVLNINPDNEMHYVFQKYDSDYFTSDVYLMFAREESFELVKLFLGSDTDIHDVPLLEQEAMTEIGNIILNACVGSLSNLLKMTIRGSLPEFKQGYARNIFSTEAAKSSDDDMLMIVYIDFGVEHKSIHGYIVLVLELNSFDIFKTQILKALLPP